MNARLFIPCGLLALLAGCVGSETPQVVIPPREVVTAQARAETATSQGRPLVVQGAPDQDEQAQRVEDFGFQIYWDSYIRDEVITSVSIEGDQLYAFTQSMRLYQIDMHSGMVNWVFDVGAPLSFTESGRPITEWTYKADENNLKQYDEIFFVARDRLFALDKKNGSELFSAVLTFTPSSAPQASASHVFVGSWDDRIYAIRKDSPVVPDWEWRTNDDVIARPAYHSPSLFVASSGGQLHSFDAATGRMKWPFPTERRLLQDPVIFKSLIYLSADDFNLYVLGVADGLIHYRYCAGAPLTTRPVPVGKTIYFGAGEEKGMFALLRQGPPKPSQGNPRKTDHELLWQRKQATMFLCKGSQDVYLRENGEAFDRHVVSRINAKSGDFRDSLEFSGVDFWVTNAFDPAHFDAEHALRGGILFLGLHNGWIIALKETATIPGA